MLSSINGWTVAAVKVARSLGAINLLSVRKKPELEGAIYFLYSVLRENYELAMQDSGMGMYSEALAVEPFNLNFITLFPD